MYMEVMHAWIFENEIWSICISAYGMCMHNHVQEWKKKEKRYQELAKRDLPSLGGTIKDLGQPLTRFKGNKPVWGSRKVNSSLMYRYELGPEKQAITQRWEEAIHL